MRKIIVTLLAALIAFSAFDKTVQAQTTEQSKFNMGGFISLSLNSWWVEDEKKSALGIKDLSKNEPIFSQSNLNLYFMYNTYQNWSAFSEIKFLYVQSGMQYNKDEETNQIYVEQPRNSYTDEMLKDYDIGGIFIERAYIEYNRFEFAKVRFGRFLTPYGIFSQDHGAPAVISVRPPTLVLPVADNGMPLWQTGTELVGTIYFGDFGFEYAAYISNGPSENPNLNSDNVMCRGGFLNMILPSIADILDIEFGGSVYQGKRTYTTQNYVGPGLLPDESQDVFKLKQRELITAGHSKISLSGLPLDGKLLVQIEYLRQDVTDKTYINLIGYKQEVEDYVYDTMYAQFEYQMFAMITPYFRYETEKVSDEKAAWNVFFLGTTQYVAGINIKPIPNVSLKFEALDAKIKQKEPWNSYMNNDFRMFSFQVSMAFM